MTTIDLGSGPIDISGEYRLIADRGEFFIAGGNMCAPFGTNVDLALETLGKLTGVDNVKAELPPVSPPGSQERRVQPNPNGIGRASY